MENQATATPAPSTTSKRMEKKTVTRDSKVTVTVKYPSKLTKAKSQKVYEAEVDAALNDVRYQLLPNSTPPPVKSEPLQKEKKTPSAWNTHVAKIRKENPTLPFGEAMALAKSTYTK